MIISQNKEFSSLYFPYADPSPSSNLLFAALLFDNIYILEKNFFRKPNSDNIEMTSLKNSLLDLDCIKEIGPSLIGLNHNRSKPILDDALSVELKSSIWDDINNPDIQALAKEFNKVYWFLPNGQYLFWNGLGILFEMSNSDQHEIISEVLTNRDKVYRDFFDSKGFKNKIGSYSESRIQNPQGELMVRVPFLIAESLMITLAMHASKELGLIPFTDQPIHQKFLDAKMLSSKNKLDVSINDTIEGLNYNSIGQKTMEFALPNIKGLTVESVAKLREKCKDELYAFRQEMLAFSFYIENNPWDLEYEKEVKRIVITKVNPTLQDLESKLSDLKKDLKFQILEKTVTTSPIPILTSNIYPSIPIEWALPLSLGIVWLKELLQFYSKRSALKKNGLNFLLKMQKM